jgi:integrase
MRLLDQGRPAGEGDASGQGSGAVEVVAADLGSEDGDVVGGSTVHLTGAALRRQPDINRGRVAGEQRRVAGQPKDLVFVSTSGQPVDPRSVNRAFDRLLTKAEVPHSRVHDLRHTCATLLLAEGASDREVMELLGHSSIGITMNTYAHVLDDSKRRMASRMDGLFGEGG